jgi:predicted nucleotidyltransferase
LGTLRRQSIRLPSLLRTLCQAAAAELDPHTATLYLWGSALTDDFRPETSDVDALLVLSAPVDSAAIERFKKHVAIERFDLSVIAAENKLRHERLSPEILAAEIAAARYTWGREDLVRGMLPPVGSLGEQLRHRLASLRRRLAIHDTDPASEPVPYILKEIGFIGRLRQQLANGTDDLARDAVMIAARTRDNGWREIDTAAVIALAHRLLHELEAYSA